MKAATIHQIKEELVYRKQEELLEFCLRLAKFKKENKELLTYLLFEAQDEEAYIRSVQDEMDLQFERINRTNYYFIKKSIRKIQRMIRKYVRYSKNKETEVELFIYFCQRLNGFNPSIFKNRALSNLYNRQLVQIKKTLAGLDEDLQFDYGEELKALATPKY